MMPVTLHVKSTDSEIRAHREHIAVRVRECFSISFATPTQLSVLCYLDDRDVGWLKDSFGGGSNRGVHWPIRGQGLSGWPQDMWDTIASVDPNSGNVL